MPNSYFQFKQFTIYQDKCSMKVCTDACILGAWAADAILLKKIEASKCLDIGTGTGLLSLMLTQKTNACIDAIELDANAFIQASDNFKRSGWSKRLTAFHTDAKDFCPGTNYDFIICNPPFYEDDLLSPAEAVNVARHNKGLKLRELVMVISNNLNAPGKFALLLPYHRISYFEVLAKQNHFFPEEKILIKPTSKHDYFRGILLFSHTATNTVIKELIIKNNETYSEDFVALMKDYYLFL